MSIVTSDARSITDETLHQQMETCWREQAQQKLEDERRDAEGELDEAIAAAIQRLIHKEVYNLQPINLVDQDAEAVLIENPDADTDCFETIGAVESPLSGLVFVPGAATFALIVIDELNDYYPVSTEWVARELINENTIELKDTGNFAVLIDWLDELGLLSERQLNKRRRRLQRLLTASV